jgi:hydrogenase/urease accessory protein HupE
MLCAFTLLAMPLQLCAHDPGLSAANFSVDEKQLVAHLSVAQSDLQTLAASHDKSRLAAIGREAFDLSLDGHQLAILDAGTRPEDNAVEFTISFARAKGTKLLVRSLLLAKLPRGHRQYVSLRDSKGNIIDDYLLDASNPIWETRLPDAAEPEIQDHTFGRFLRLGIDHILTGYDHLAFLLGLLIIGVSLREAAKIITSFTVAHSFTLALATLNLIRLSPLVIEPLIAVSIVYIGLENIFRQNLRWRWLLTFGFGLVHGCGLASALRERGIGVDGNRLAVPLLSFNLGVEIGQLAIALVLLPLIWRFKKHPDFTRRYSPACSILISAAGAYWLAQRIFF